MCLSMVKKAMENYQRTDPSQQMLGMVLDHTLVIDLYQS